MFLATIRFQLALVFIKTVKYKLTSFISVFPPILVVVNYFLVVYYHQIHMYVYAISELKNNIIHI